MTINLKIQIDDVADVELVPVGGSTNSTLTILLNNGPLNAWDNGATGNGNVQLDLLGQEFDFSFPVNNNHADNVVRTKINQVQITAPTDILTTFYNLILLKSEVKDMGNHPQGIFDFELTINKDIGKQTDHWDITTESFPGANDRILKLSVADFEGQLDTSKISIDDTAYHHDPDNKIRVIEERRGQKQALLDLERLLKHTLPTKYGVKYSDDPDLTELDFERGPDADFTDQAPEVDNPPTAATPVPTAGLWAYAVGKLGDNPSIPFQDSNIKHILGELNDGTDYVYKSEIEEWIEYLEVGKIYFSELKIKKKSELAIFLDPNGWGRDSNDMFENAEILKEPGLYKGFPLIDPNLKAIPDPADGNKFKVSTIDPNKPVRYTKKNIDDFRDFADNYTGPNADIFTKEKTIKNKNVGNVQVFANRLPEECLGFQPGDIYRTNTSYLYRNGLKKFKGFSKVVMDIWAAQNAEEAMDLAFFGKDYEEPLSHQEKRKGNPPFLQWKKHPNINLQFNEISGLSKLNTLNTYYEALKNVTECRWVIQPNATAGTTLKSAPKYNDPDTKKKIDNGYQLASKWVTDYEKWISKSDYFSSLNKTQLEEAKTKLEKWKTTRFYTSGGVWKPVIDNFLTEVNNALAHLGNNDNPPPPPSPNNLNWRAELVGLKNRSSELAKKIYQNCQPDQDGFTKSVFEELKKLVKLLEEAHGTKTFNTKTELEKFISDSENDANKKKALEIAKKVKYQESDNEDCVELALEKLKTPQEKQLEKARQELKSLLTGLKINGKDAYEEIITEIKDSETNINKVIEIWQKCQEIDNATSDDNGELLNALNNYKNDPNNKKAWEAVNKYKKDAEGNGYANDLLKKLNDWSEQRKKDHWDIRNAKSKAEFEAAKRNFTTKQEYEKEKQDYDKIYFPLWEKAAEIREKGSNASEEEKNLVELITVAASDYSDWKTQLEDLEDKLNKLKKYNEDIEKSKIIKNYSTIQQEALKNLINKMEEKVKRMRAEKAKSESNNLSQENPPWYRTPLGIFGIMAIIIVIIGWVVFYFVKQNANEER